MTIRSQRTVRLDVEAGRNEIHSLTVTMEDEPLYDGSNMTIGVNGEHILVKAGQFLEFIRSLRLPEPRTYDEFR